MLRKIRILIVDDEESILNSPFNQINYELPNIGVKTNYIDDRYYPKIFAINFKLIQNKKLRKKRLKKQKKEVYYIIVLNY